MPPLRCALAAPTVGVAGAWGGLRGIGAGRSIAIVIPGETRPLLVETIRHTLAVHHFAQVLPGREQSSVKRLAA